MNREEGTWRAKHLKTGEPTLPSLVNQASLALSPVEFSDDSLLAQELWNPLSIEVDGGESNLFPEKFGVEDFSSENFSMSHYCPAKQILISVPVEPQGWLKVQLSP